MDCVLFKNVGAAPQPSTPAGGNGGNGNPLVTVTPPGTDKVCNLTTTMECLNGMIKKQNSLSEYKEKASSSSKGTNKLHISR
jgi:hypothetical protein